MALTESDIKIIIAAELKNKGFKDAEKASNSLNTQFKKLGKTVLTVFGTREIVQFGKAAVAAFTEDEVAARRFEQALKGVNLGFATPAIENYLENLERQTAITKGELRPAFQQLAATTRSVAMSQDILNTAMDVSAGTGVDLNTVVNDLSRAFLGNNTSLSKYNLGLSRTELRTKSFSEIQELLNEQFTGQRAAYLETYAGKVSLLQAGYERMQTTVGQGLVDAFQILSGEQGIGAGISAMEIFAEKIADTTRGIAGLISSFGSFQSYASTVLQFVKGLASERSVIGAIASIGEQNRPLFFPTAGVGQPAVDRRLAAIEEAAIKRQKELEALRLKSLREQEKANRLKRISIALMEKEKKFDITRIQLQAALQGKLTAEEARRVQELMLIEETKQAVAEGNVDKAEELMDKLKKLQDETIVLAEKLTTFPEANDPFTEWTKSLTGVMAQLTAIAQKKIVVDFLANFQFAPAFIPSFTPASQAVASGSSAASAAAASAAEAEINLLRGDAAAAEAAAAAAAAEAAAAKAQAEAALALAESAAEAAAAMEAIRAAEEAAKAAEAIAESARALEYAAAKAAADEAARLAAEAENIATLLAAEAAAAAANAALSESTLLFEESVISAAAAEVPLTQIVVNVEGSVIAAEDLAETITDIQYNYQKTGKGLLYSSTAI